MPVQSLARVLAATSFAQASPAVLAQVDTDAIADLLVQPGSAGLGFLLRYEKSPYLDAGQRSDLLPERLRGARGGLHGRNDQRIIGRG